VRIDTPSLRADGFKVEFNTGYGNPWGDILLTDDGRTRLQWVSEDDCDQIIKAAAELKSQIIDSRTWAAMPHGRGRLFKGRCQLCGKPEDDELHAEPAPVITEQAASGLCDSELPLKHGGALKCALDAGHYGAHSAIAGDFRWLGHGADARDEEGNRIAPIAIGGAA